MRRPVFPITTAAGARQARRYLGIDKTEMAKRLRLGPHSRDTVRRWETDGPTGPGGLALERLVEIHDEEGKTP